MHLFRDLNLKFTKNYFILKLLQSMYFQSTNPKFSFTDWEQKMSENNKGTLGGKRSWRWLKFKLANDKFCKIWLRFVEIRQI